MHFPLFVDLTEKEILVVGAGTIALRRIRTLCGFAGKITVVAPQILPEIQALAQEYPIEVQKRFFAPDDLQGRALVLAATDDRALNRTIAALCKERGILVNVSSDQSLCDFQFPSVTEKDGVVIALNGSGKDHRRVKELRQAVERSLKITQQESRYTD